MRSKTSQNCLVTLCKPEREVILDWYATFSERLYHFGGPEIEIPSEKLLLDRLRSENDAPIFLCEDEVLIVSNWMNMVMERYGSEIYLFGFEQLVYSKIEDAVRRFRDNLYERNQ